MARKISLQRKFKDEFRPECHTYYLVDEKERRQVHLCNLTQEYSSYYGKRMWHLDPLVGPSAKYPTKAEAIKDATIFLAVSKSYGADLAQEYAKERDITFDAYPSVGL